jgi:glycosyltransferase involved in cell wall biosynthesis
MIRLSVVIPTYNRRELTLRAVLHVLDNDCVRRNEVEVFVVDDGSSDGTVDFLRGHFSDNPSVQIVGLARVFDPAICRNTGIELAKGEWLAFLDSDDFWRKGRLDRLWRYLDQADLLCEDRRFENDECELDADAYLRQLLSVNFAPLSSYVVRRELILAAGKFSTGFYGPQKRWDRGWEDYELMIGCACSRVLGRPVRAMILTSDDVVIEPQAGGVGRVQIREQMRRELWTLIRRFRVIPLSLKALVIRRMLGSIRAIAR